MAWYWQNIAPGHKKASISGKTAILSLLTLNIEQK